MIQVTLTPIIILVLLFTLILIVLILFYKDLEYLKKQLSNLKEEYNSKIHLIKCENNNNNKRINPKMNELASRIHIENNRKRYEELDNIHKQLFDAVCSIPYTDYKEVNNQEEYYIFKTNNKDIEVEIFYYPHNGSYMVSPFEFHHKINGVKYKCATIGYIYGFIEYIESLRIERNNQLRNNLFEKL